MEASPDLAIIIVSWNVRELLRQCLASVLEDLRDRVLRGEIYVVDNASTDGTAEMVASLSAPIGLIRNPTNLGFTKANNQALRLVRSPYALLLNPDSVVKPASLRLMFDYLERHRDVAVVGPRLLYPDGTDQPSRRRFPTVPTAFLESTPLQRFFPDNRVLRRYYLSDKSPAVEHEVDWLIGACLMVRREAWQQVGLLDEAFFMYSEELDWCRRIKRRGWRIVYLPDAQVVHHEARSSEQNVLARQQHFHDSKVRYFRKYHGGAAAFALRLFTVLSFAFMLSEETLKYIAVPKKRTWRRPRLPVLAAALRYHLRRIVV